MDESVVLFGAGGHARSMISLLNCREIKIFGVFDDSFNSHIKEKINSVELLGKIADYNSTHKVILSIGDNIKRRGYFLSHRTDMFKDSIVHPTSFIDQTVQMGNSNNIFAKTVLNSNVIIGENNIINTAAILEHEVVIGSHNHISVGAIICGRTRIGDNCFIGAGAVIIDKITICNEVRIGANTVVVKAIDQPGLYVGNPAIKIK